MVFEQCPEEIDQYIQPSDSEILALHLKDFSVTRPDIPSPSPNGGANGSDANAAKAPKPGAHGNGSPRTVRFTFTFSPNPWFHDTTLTKTFTHRRTLSGASHYTSVPVRINWKSEEGKEDLTAGAGSMACALQDAIDAMVTSAPAGEDAGGKEKRLDLSGVKSRARTLQKKIQELKEYKALAAKVEASSEGSQSFFAWFGYRGRYVSEEEARIGEEAWSAILNGEDLDRVEEEGEEDVEDLLEGGLLEEEADDEAEIFPAGEELATVLADDLWVNALKYFSKFLSALLVWIEYFLAFRLNDWPIGLLGV